MYFKPKQTTQSQSMQQVVNTQDTINTQAVNTALPATATEEKLPKDYQMFILE